MLIKPTEAELLHAIVDHPHGLLDSMADVPGAVFYRAHNVTWYTTPVVSPMFTGAMRFNLADHEIDDAIKQVKSKLADSGAPFAFWWRRPEYRPHDLGPRLVAHGVEPWHLEAPGMAIEIDRMTNNVAIPSNLRIEVVKTLGELLDWKPAFVAGMEVPEFAGQAWVDATSQAGIERAKWRLLTAYLADGPVAVAGVIGVAGVASVFAVATTPSARRQGIGGAITEAGLRLMRSEGYRWGVLFSTDVGEPVYRRLGFKPYCTISRYLWRNPSTELPPFGQENEGRTIPALVATLSSCGLSATKRRDSSSRCSSS